MPLLQYQNQVRQNICLLKHHLALALMPFASVIVISYTSPTLTVNELHLKNEEWDKLKIVDAPDRCDWNQTHAARLLNISRTTLSYKVKHYRLRRD